MVDAKPRPSRQEVSRVRGSRPHRGPRAWLHPIARSALGGGRPGFARSPGPHLGPGQDRTVIATHMEPRPNPPSNENILDNSPQPSIGG